MSAPSKRITIVLAILLLITACAQEEPAATSVPPTATTIAVVPTATKAPPTKTPLLPTDTPVLPTNTPTLPATEPTPTPTAVAEPGVAGNLWIKTYGRNRNSVGGRILLAEDGGYFIVGTTNVQFEPEQRGDVYLIRTDAAGEVLWEKTYGVEGRAEGQAITRASDGGLVIAGRTASLDAQDSDAYLLKVDQDGNELWSKTFGDPLDEMAGVVRQTADGGYILIGNVVDPNDFVADPGAAGYAGADGRSNIYLIKTDGDGNELWSHTYDSENNIMASSGLQTPDGGFLILATIMYYPDNDDDIYLLKVDQDGNEIWSRTWQQGMSSGYDLIQTSDGNFLVTGPYSPPEDMDRSRRDFLFVKFDPEGKEIWTSTFGDANMIESGSVLAETADGGFVAAGERVADLFTWDADISLVKIDGNGHLLWEQTIETDAHSMLASVLQHPDGSYAITGATYNGRTFDIILIRMNREENSSENSSTPPPTEAVAELITYLEDLASQDQLSGVVLIAHDGEPIFAEAYGMANLSFEAPNRVDTKFNLGSMNKMFTAVAILQLAEEGRLSVDDSIADHLPDYPNREIADRVTIHHLLTHTSGMGNVFVDEYDATPKDQFRSAEDFLPLFVDTPLQFEPGAQFAYSNAGYVVLGLIIEAVTGQSYYDYVMENIYEPSGMINTDAYELDAVVPNLAIGYTPRDFEGNELGRLISNFYVLPAKGFPAGGGYSTAEDLLAFSNALLNYQLLSRESTEMLLEGKVEIVEDTYYAYGFFNRTVAGQRVVGHSGGFPGICDFMDIYPDLGYTVIVLSNMDGGCLPVLDFLREGPLR